MTIRVHIGLFLALALVASSSYATAKWFHGRGHGKQKASASVSVVTGLPGCKVDVDGTAGGTTDSEGNLIVKSVIDGEHYVHVLCPGQRTASYFISPPAGKEVEVDARAAATNSRAADNPSLNPAASELELRRMVSDADQLRSSGKFEEAVTLLRKATMLDPRNGDLHRELGITFLMYHDWESARVEMLEAIHREPESVDAHSGLAYALEKLGDLDEALKQYRICTQMDPHDTSYRDHYVEVLGLLYTEKGKKKH
jgi:tetratricopeptide (TPR) repeat protein